MLIDLLRCDRDDQSLTDPSLAVFHWTRIIPVSEYPLEQKNKETLCTLSLCYGIFRDGCTRTKPLDMDEPGTYCLDPHSDWIRVQQSLDLKSTFGLSKMPESGFRVNPDPKQQSRPLVGYKLKSALKTILVTLSVDRWLTGLQSTSLCNNRLGE